MLQLDKNKQKWIVASVGVVVAGILVALICFVSSQKAKASQDEEQRLTQEESDRLRNEHLSKIADAYQGKLRGMDNADGFFLFDVTGDSIPELWVVLDKKGLITSTKVQGFEYIDDKLRTIFNNGMTDVRVNPDRQSVSLITESTFINNCTDYYYDNSVGKMKKKMKNSITDGLKEAGEKPDIIRVERVGELPVLMGVSDGL